MASAPLHEFFIQPTDAGDGGKTDPAGAEPAVLEEQEESRVCVNAGMDVLEPRQRCCDRLTRM